MKFEYVVGIDEAGKGPLAGPVAVGALAVTADFDWRRLPTVNDSKQLKESVREDIYKEVIIMKKAGELDFRVSMVSASVIDQIGISRSVARALARALTGLSLDPAQVAVKLDGSLKAPAIYTNQETIIKGDAKEKVIGLASIMAKVRRDRYMKNLAKQPELASYQLAVLKGYGTKIHRAAIKENGLSSIHRASFCRALLG